MNVSEKHARIWRNDKQTKDGRTSYKYRTSVSSKNSDGSFSRAYIDVKFAKRSGAPEKIVNGAQCDFNGFITVDSYKDKEGKEHTRPLIMIMEAVFDTDPEDLDDVDPADKAAGFEQTEIPIPF